MEEEKIARINELARLAKVKRLTEEERMEQAALRQEYLDAVRSSLKAQLDKIDVVNEDGSIENLGEKYGKKGN